MAVKDKIRAYKDGVAIVTGGALGIGRGLCEALAENGCDVVVCDLKDDLAEQVAEGIRAKGGKASAVKLDVTDFNAVEKVVKDTYERTGRLDYMFNNAGIGIGGEIQNLNIGAWNKLLDVNIRGVVNGVQAAYTLMHEQGFGHIINTSSIAVFMLSAASAPYVTSKWAVFGMTKALRAEAPISGIRVSCLCPGFVRTAVFDDADKYGVTEEQTQKGLKLVEPMMIDPSRLAKKTLKMVKKNKAVICAPGWIRILWWANWAMPAGLEINIAKWTYMMMQKTILKEK